MGKKFKKQTDLNLLLQTSGWSCESPVVTVIDFFSLLLLGETH